MKGYGQFCPVAKAAEILTERWTPLVLRDLLGGNTRFNELRRGVALMSPSLLSLERALSSGKLEAHGPSALRKRLKAWLRLNVFAGVRPGLGDPSPMKTALHTRIR